MNTMNGLEEIMESVGRTMSEFSDLLEKRDAELERRARFDEEIDRMIREIKAGRAGGAAPLGFPAGHAAETA